MAITLTDDYLILPDGNCLARNQEECEFYVYNGNHWSPTNGGSCCCWIVPDGTNWIKFDILSGGGPGGSSGGDYDMGLGGQGGNFISKYLNRTNKASTTTTTAVDAAVTTIPVSNTAGFPTRYNGTTSTLSSTITDSQTVTAALASPLYSSKTTVATLTAPITTITANWQINGGTYFPPYGTPTVYSYYNNYSAWDGYRILYYANWQGEGQPGFSLQFPEEGPNGEDYATRFRDRMQNGDYITVVVDNDSAWSTQGKILKYTFQLTNKNNTIVMPFTSQIAFTPGSFSTANTGSIWEGPSDGETWTNLYLFAGFSTTGNESVLITRNKAPQAWQILKDTNNSQYIIEFYDATAASNFKNGLSVNDEYWANIKLLYGIVEDLATWKFRIDNTANITIGTLNFTNCAVYIPFSAITDIASYPGTTNTQYYVFDHRRYGLWKPGEVVTASEQFSYSSRDATHFYGITRGVNGTTPTAFAANSKITLTSDQITVDATTGFPSSGTFTIDSEQISYTSTDSTHLIGITRGVNNTTPSIHNNFTQLNLTKDYVDIVNAHWFPNAGTIKIESEEINYTSRGETQIYGITRGANGTTAASHANGTTVTMYGLKLGNETITYTSRDARNLYGVTRGISVAGAQTHSSGENVTWCLNDNFYPGYYYNICAGGTSDCSCCCSCNMNCRHGCKSFVTGMGLENLCAQGGMGGSTSWDMSSNCYNCMIGNIQCSRGNYNAGWVNHVCNEATYGRYHTDSGVCNDLIEFRGTSGSYRSQYDCCTKALTVQGAPTGPWTAPHGAGGKNRCVGNLACCSSHAAFPGGGGPGHQTDAIAACWGNFGAGGLVKVTFG